jgi:cytochrome P450
MTFADGHVGWLVTGYDVARTILADQRFSIRRDLAHSPHEALPHDTRADPAPPGLFVRMDPPDHTRYRRMLVGEFTAHRVKRLASQVEQTTRQCLDQMARSGPPVDLVRALAIPVPMRLICELLGVPSDIRPGFENLVDVSVDPAASSAERRQAEAAMAGFFAPLIESKRQTPTDDIYGNLIVGGELTDQELAVIGMLLFGAGSESTASMLALSAFALLEHPAQAEALRADRSLIDNAVEELLRYASGPEGMLRTALQDVEINGELIGKGQTVELLTAAANRDPAHFADPNTLDLSRSAKGHLGFGHGIHQCLGAQIARMEMRVVLPALFERFPSLRLAVPANEVEMRDDSPGFFGVKSLPIRW